MFLKKLLPVMALFTLVVVSCGKDGGEPEFKFENDEVQIDYGKSLDLNLSDAEGATYESSDESVAYITDDGIVFADLVGKATIKAFAADNKRFAKCEVTVLPTISMYIEPIMAAKVTKTSVKSYEKPLRSLVEKQGTGLLYSGENSYVHYVMYIFDSSTAYLKSSIVLLPTTVFAKNLAKLFIEQRYVYEGDNEGFSIYSRGNVLVAINEDETLGLNTFYLLNTSISAAPSNVSLQQVVEAAKASQNAMKRAISKAE